MNLTGCPINDYNRGITELEPLQVKYVKEGKNIECKPEKTIQEKQNYTVTRYRIS
jgi:hypothetical protein